MTTTTGQHALRQRHTLRQRILAVLAALAMIASLVAVSAPAAWGSIDMSIPIDTVVRGKVGAQGVLATAETGDLEGQVCSVSSTSENQRSTHPNNDLIVASGSTSVTLEDVEREPGGTVHAEGTLTLGPTVTVTLVLGEDGVFSGGLTLNIDCEDILPEPGQIIVEKVVTAGSDQSVAFTFTTDFAISDNTLAHGESGTSGDLDAGTYSVSETVPAGWNLVSAVCDDGSDPSAIGLSAGETVTCLFTNAQEISEPEEPVTDLEVTKIDLVDPVVVDSDNPTALITYEVTVANNGPELAENVVVTDTLPASLTYVSSSPGVGTCAHAAGVVTCQLGDLAVGDSVLITIVVETEAVGEITDTSPVNVVEVSSDTEEVNLENNVDSEETNIVEVLDLVVLPFTGIDAPFMLAGAVMLLGAGLSLVFVSRRREFEI